MTGREPLGTAVSGAGIGGLLYEACTWLCTWLNLRKGH